MKCFLCNVENDRGRIIDDNFICVVCLPLLKRLVFQLVSETFNTVLRRALNDAIPIPSSSLSPNGTIMENNDGNDL